MIPAFEKEYLISGTIDFEKIKEIAYLRHLPMIKLGHLHRFLIREAWISRGSAYESLEKFISQEFRSKQENFPQIIPHQLEYVDSGMTCNASDSLITRMNEDWQFQAEMKVRLSCKERIISFEVEDNGIGLDQTAESHLFSKHFSIKRRISKLSKIYHGRDGAHMYNSKNIIKQFGGEIYFLNKGQNIGAIFGYKIPLEALQ